MLGYTSAAIDPELRVSGISHFLISHTPLPFETFSDVLHKTPPHVTMIWQAYGSTLQIPNYPAFARTLTLGP
jgi:hypothetical protein